MLFFYLNCFWCVCQYSILVIRVVITHRFKLFYEEQMQHLVLFMKLLHCKVLITTKTFKQLHNVKYLKDIKYLYLTKYYKLSLKLNLGQSIQEWAKWNLWKIAFKKSYLVHSWILCPIYDLLVAVKLLK